jgi:hypothetical protein
MKRRSKAMNRKKPAKRSRRKSRKSKRMRKTRKSRGVHYVVLQTPMSPVQRYLSSFNAYTPPIILHTLQLDV